MAYQTVQNPYLQSAGAEMPLHKLCMAETTQDVSLSDCIAMTLEDNYLPGSLINGGLDTTNLSYFSQTQGSFPPQHLFHQSPVQRSALELGSDHTSFNASRDHRSYQSSTTPESESTEELGHGNGGSLAWPELPVGEWRPDYPFGAHFNYEKWDAATELRVLGQKEQVRLDMEGVTALVLPAAVAGRVHSEQEHLCSMHIQTGSNDDVAQGRFESPRQNYYSQTLSPATLGESTDHLAVDGLSTLSYDQTWGSPTENVLHSHREAQDQYLIKSKLSGMSYKEIKEQGKFKEAESTLRGRFRTLTKSKDQRVRKPQWQERDVSLPLLRSCGSIFSHLTSVSRSNCSDKLSLS